MTSSLSVGDSSRRYHTPQYGQATRCHLLPPNPGWDPPTWPQPHHCHPGTPTLGDPTPPHLIPKTPPPLIPSPPRSPHILTSYKGQQSHDFKSCDLTITLFLFGCDVRSFLHHIYWGYPQCIHGVHLHTICFLRGGGSRYRPGISFGRGISEGK